MAVQREGAVQGNTKSPMEYVKEAQPIKVHGTVVASYGSEQRCLHVFPLAFH